MLNRPLQRKSADPKARPIVAYDLETTPIAAGTPRPLYFTAFDGHDLISQAVDNFDDLHELLHHSVLPKWRKYRFVAWNGNRFDAYLVALALIHDPDYMIKPYLARNKTLRGMMIKDQHDHSWEFLDGIAMTGIEKKLGEFVATYAPAFPKLDLDLSNQTFNPRDPEHRAYAERDSIALWHAMTGVNDQAMRLTGMPLMTTIGALGIRFFQSMMPMDKSCWKAPDDLDQIFFTDLMRGGYCHCVDKYKGPIWKYDINQAYAAAMRDCRLPAGRVSRTRRYHEGRPGFYQVDADVPNRIPFYSKRAGQTQWSTHFSAWLTGDEVAQLYNEDASIRINEGWIYDDSFSMIEMVAQLERLRQADPAGPSGPQGLLCKSLGNNAYGKTVERLEGIELAMSCQCPAGYMPYGIGDETPELAYIWWRRGRSILREWHKPQIGIHITAYNRMVLRRAILLDPDAWRYSDTDCVMFSRPVDLDTHPSRYGAWKIESAGEPHIIVDKKVYASSTGVHAKGLHRKSISLDEMRQWHDGEYVPVQWQEQRVNFMKLIAGQAMFETKKRRGTLKVTAP